VLIAGFARQGYSHFSEFISALGFGPNAIIQNIDFLVSGSLIIAFSVGLFRGVKDGRIAKIGSGLLVICGAGIFGAGIFPGIGGTYNLHLVVSFTAFVALIIAPLLFWRGLRRDERWRRYRRYSLLTGVLLAILISFIDPSSSAVGAFQRLFLGIGFLWIELMAIHLFILSRSSGRGEVPLK
jgi:hypothetical membrane protein